MSTFRAIATVTAALQAILADAVGVVGGARVAVGHPTSESDDSTAPRIDIVLYQALPHDAWRTTDRREQVAVNLHYLLMFQGDEARLEPELLLGCALRRLHDEPILTAKRILQVEESAPAASDLATQDESIRFSPLPLSIDDLSKIRALFAPTTYALALAYQAGIVLIDGAP